ncbi:hypothetical protein HGI47_00005 [Novosphingobium sp. ERN07]|uniref:hypothetical protein n=1 Tax=Novosphingobium sp. ERN07 TaxID=2726187 RepID=UPI00145638C9|nr:hypothetical protein [Novosphingobium sp. ERN07]NLR69255.1 hypothetical protein [Novosphingobium sp. ERN07]
MAKVRDILIGVRIEQAQRQRKCRRNTSHTISKGEWCLVVRTNATNDDYSYSRDAAKPMLDEAWAKLKTIYEGLGLLPPGS